LGIISQGGISSDVSHYRINIATITGEYWLFQKNLTIFSRIFPYSNIEIKKHNRKIHSTIILKSLCRLEKIKTKSSKKIFIFSRAVI